jgi:hypothetical protein
MAKRNAIDALTRPIHGSVDGAPRIAASESQNSAPRATPLDVMFAG